MQCKYNHAADKTVYFGFHLIMLIIRYLFIIFTQYDVFNKTLFQVHSIEIGQSF